MALNEVIAYIALGAQKASLDPRSFTIATFALCGFANLTDRWAWQIGGIERIGAQSGATIWRGWAFCAMLAGTMANLISSLNCRDVSGVGRIDT